LGLGFKTDETFIKYKRNAKPVDISASTFNTWYTPAKVLHPTQAQEANANVKWSMIRAQFLRLEPTSFTYKREPLNTLPHSLRWV